MNTRHRLLCLLSCALVVLSIGATGASIAARAAGSHARTHKSACAKRTVPKSQIIYSDWQFPDTLSPAQSTLLVTTEITDGMFDGLFQYDNHSRLVPQLATSVPSVQNHEITNGGMTITVHIKPRQRWSDGAEITSQDIKFSLAVSMEKDSGPACLGSCDVISRIDTPDKYTAVFHFKRVYAPALANAVNGFGIWPSKWSGAWNNNPRVAAHTLYQDTKFNFEGPDFPTNGAYQIAPGGFSQSNRVTLRPMKYYQDMNCGAFVKKLVFSYFGSKPSMITAASAGATDVTFNYTAADLPALRQNNAYKIFNNPSYSFEHLEFNTDPKYNGKSNPLHDSRVRAALALAIDKETLIRSALTMSASQATQIEAWSPWVNLPSLVQAFADKKLKGQWDPIAKKYQTTTGRGQALVDAKKLLAETPYGSGFSVDFFTTAGDPTRKAEEDSIAQAWQQIGVTVNLNLVESSRLFANYNQGGNLYTGNFQAALFAFTGPPEPDGLKFDLTSRFIDREQKLHSDINSNHAGIHDAIIDKNFDGAAHTLTSKVRAKDYAAVQVELNKQAYWVGLFYRPSIATEDGKVLNFSTNPTGAPEWNIYNWRTKAS